MSVTAVRSGTRGPSRWTLTVNASIARARVPIHATIRSTLGDTRHSSANSAPSPSESRTEGVRIQTPSDQAFVDVRSTVRVTRAIATIEPIAQGTTRRGASLTRLPLSWPA